GLVVLYYSWRSAEGAANWKGEGLADLVLDKVDAVEISGGGPWSEPEDWYTLLNAGLRATPVAGSCKASNLHTLGGFRTYARLQPGEEFTYAAWIEAIRAGRTFVTNGPLLTLQTNGADPGATLELGASAPIQVRAEARGLTGLRTLELLFNG